MALLTIIDLSYSETTNSYCVLFGKNRPSKNDRRWGCADVAINLMMPCAGNINENDAYTRGSSVARHALLRHISICSTSSIANTLCDGHAGVHVLSTNVLHTAFLSYTYATWMHLRSASKHSAASSISFNWKWPVSLYSNDNDRRNWSGGSTVNSL